MALDRMDFEAKFPNFDTALIDAYWFRALEELCLFGVDIDCGCSNDAIMYAIAHLLTVYGNIDAGKPITVGEAVSKSVDGVSVSYRQTTGDYNAQERFWRSTPYGDLYWMSRRGCGIGSIFV